MRLPLQAVSADGGLTVFNIEDCPKLVDDEFFYLANKPGTSLLRKNSIFRGSDIFSAEGRRLFEGDVWQDDTGTICIVQFHNGFKLRTPDGAIRTPDQRRPLTYLGSWVSLRGDIKIPQGFDKYYTAPKYGKIRYIDFSRDLIFHLFDIISASDEYVLVNKLGGTIAAFDGIGQFSGVKQPSGMGYYYGQQIKGFGTVAIQSGFPGIQTPNGFRSFGDVQFRRISTEKTKRGGR